MKNLALTALFLCVCLTLGSCSTIWPTTAELDRRAQDPGAAGESSESGSATLSPRTQTWHVTRMRQGLVEGFPAEHASKRFDSSAVIANRSKAWIAGDRPAPASIPSSVIRVPLSSLRTKSIIGYNAVTPVPAKAFLDARKIEAMASSPEGVSFACTAFDRNSEADGPFNRLLAWPSDKIEEAAVLHVADSKEEEDSISVRNLISQALAPGKDAAAPPYFKIEGLAALPGRRLWFGIRQMGLSHEEGKNSYTFRILEVPWQKKDGAIVLQRPCKTILHVSQKELMKLGVDRADNRVGLSSLEYDPYRNIVWAAASWEEEKTDRSWLFFIESPTTAPVLRRGPDARGKLLAFPHKVEGLAVLDARSLLAISDEDGREITIKTPEGSLKSKPHMGVWSILSVPVGR